MTRPMGGRVGVGQLVISTSTIRPSRSALSGFGRDCASLPRTRCGRVLSHPFRIRGADRTVVGRDFCAGRDDDGLGHAFVERNDNILPIAASGICEVKCADDGGVAAFQNAEDAALHAAVGLGRVDVDQDLVALHGVADLVGRDENIFSFRSGSGRAGFSIGADEAVAVAVQIETAGERDCLSLNLNRGAIPSGRGRWEDSNARDRAGRVGRGG